MKKLFKIYPVKCMFGFGFSFSACSVMFKIVHHNSLNHIHRVKRFSRLKKKYCFAQS